MLANPERSFFAIPTMPAFTPTHRLLQAGIRLQAHAFKSVMRYQIEALSFARRRCENDVKLMEDLAGSELSGDAFDVVANFVQNAFSDYAAEAARVASMGARLTSETAKHVREEADGTLQDMAAATAAA